MLDYVELWCEDMMKRRSGSPVKHAQAWGECNLHTGPSTWKAKIKIGLGPSSELEIIDQLDKAISARFKRDGWFDYVIFGVLDVLMTDLRAPYGTFALTILDAEIDEMHSRASAFRLAARDAVTKMLPALW